MRSRHPWAGRRVRIQPANGEEIGLHAGAAILEGRWSEVGGGNWVPVQGGRVVYTRATPAVIQYAARRARLGLDLTDEPIYVHTTVQTCLGALASLGFLVAPEELAGLLDGPEDGALERIDVEALGGGRS